MVKRRRFWNEVLFTLNLGLLLGHVFIRGDWFSWATLFTGLSTLAVGWLLVADNRLLGNGGSI